MRQGTPCLLGSGSRVEEEGGGRRVGAGDRLAGGGGGHAETSQANGRKAAPPDPEARPARARPAEASLGTRRPELLCRMTVLQVRRGRTSGSHGADPRPGRRPVSLRCSRAGPVLRSTASGASSTCAPPVLECQPTKRQLRCKRSPAPPNLIRIWSYRYTSYICYGSGSLHGLFDPPHYQSVMNCQLCAHLQALSCAVPIMHTMFHSSCLYSSGDSKGGVNFPHFFMTTDYFMSFLL